MMQSADKKLWRPMWIPDEQEDKCLNCSSQFNTLLRRHHCRQCGNIFCNNCSSKRQSLPQLHYDRPVRICNRCSDLAHYSKLALSDDVMQRIESSKGFCNMSLDALGRKMIITNFLEVMLTLLSRFETSVYRHTTRAIANLAENEINRVDIIESSIFGAFVDYMLNPHDDDHQIILNIYITGRPVYARADRAGAFLQQPTETLGIDHPTQSYKEHTHQRSGDTRWHHTTKNQRKIVEGGSLPPLILMINSPVEKVILYSVASLASLSENSDNQISIGQVGGVRPMINLLHYSNQDKIPLYAATTLYYLSLCQTNFTLLLQQELFDTLSKIIIVNYTNTSHELLLLALKILGNLSSESSTDEHFKNNGTLYKQTAVILFGHF
ncbi:hypothetical protein PPL_00923 [Heterostelium album PN500]|uniref:FYVE-type domain-containing protein n=1 Tax=Heterostelium pallidum (strain ATCC 26659 / Pp 5 / PN500) TaxID=670386 RepID=D3AXL7_HETP5|nr:hypothetical protein PPL_00923 [Heterostelium album PN500]EFA85694.1 hypothetical protein PPL_00923 [Heterostelium album PN500]|eukprot:XP_020437800.1 hypothetical protein PPL_00923 [Heterostelium album PN500]